MSLTSVMNKLFECRPVTESLCVMILGFVASIFWTQLSVRFFRSGIVVVFSSAIIFA